MTLTIEDGNGVSGADSFITAAEFATLEALYFATPLVAASSAVEVALRRAWVYMGALDWKPDTFKLFGGTIPDEAKAAQMTLARAELQAEGALSPSVTLSGKKTLTQVGSLGWTPQSAPNTVEAARPVVTMTMDLLRPYLARDPARDTGRTTFLDRA